MYIGFARAGRRTRRMWDEAYSIRAQARAITLVLESATAGGGIIAGARPVSYTHLDVYKRQVVGRARLLHVADACAVDPAGEQSLADEPIGFGCSLIEVHLFDHRAEDIRNRLVERARLRDIGAVSYTHLDVYKRQGRVRR